MPPLDKFNFSITSHTRRQLDVLSRWMSMSMAQVIAVAVDRLYQQETRMSDFMLDVESHEPMPCAQCGNMTHLVFVYQPDGRKIYACNLLHAIGAVTQRQSERPSTKGANDASENS